MAKSKNSNSTEPQENTQKHVFLGLTKNTEKHFYHLGHPAPRSFGDDADVAPLLYVGEFIPYSVADGAVELGHLT